MLFATLCIISNQLLMLIGSPSTGKIRISGSLAKAFEKTNLFEVERWSAMTYYELVEKIGVKINARLLWTIDEWHTLTDHHRELIVTIASRVKTDDSFDRNVSLRGYSLRLAIINCMLSMIVDIQPIAFSKMMNNDKLGWAEFSKDRIIPFCFINPLPSRTLNYFPNVELPILNMNTSKESFIIERPIRIEELLREIGITERRAEIFANELAIGYCRFEGKLSFNSTDESIFLTLFKPYLILSKAFMYVDNPEKGEKFYHTPYRVFEHMLKIGYPLTIGEVMRFLKISNQANSESTAKRILNVLRDTGLIINHSPIWTVNDYHKDYFNKYKERFQ
jgi:hypothetical protein